MVSVFVSESVTTETYWNQSLCVGPKYNKWYSFSACVTFCSCVDLICIFYVMQFSLSDHYCILYLFPFSLIVFFSPFIFIIFTNSPFHLLLSFLANAHAEFIIAVLNAKDAFFTTAMFIAQMSAKRMLTECIALASLVCPCTPLFLVLRQLCLRWMSSIRLL